MVAVLVTAPMTLRWRSRRAGAEETPWSANQTKAGSLHCRIGAGHEKLPFEANTMMLATCVKSSAFLDLLI